MTTAGSPRRRARHPLAPALRADARHLHLLLTIITEAGHTIILIIMVRRSHSDSALASSMGGEDFTDGDFTDADFTVAVSMAGALVGVGTSVAPPLIGAAFPAAERTYVTGRPCQT